MTNLINQASNKMGLQINYNKTSSMVVHGEGKIKIQAKELDAVPKFKYLGSYVTPDGSSDTEIKIRLAQARNVTMSMTALWKSKELSRRLKVRLARALVWSIALYGCETWTLRKSEERMIDVFELWLWRRLLMVKWTERRTNEWVRKEVDVTAEQGMLEEVRRRKLKKYGHWKRRGESLVLATIEGELCAKGRQGRRKREWIDDIIDWRGGVDSARRAAIERSAYGSNWALAS